MDIAIKIHLLVVMLAIVLGLLNIVLSKGTRFHKINGNIWACLMLLTSFSSFFIMPTGSLSWLHLFAIVVIVSVSAGIVAIRKHRKRLHIRCMLGAYIGTIISAVFAAGIPGRLLHEVVSKNIF
jgi:uncharacterized membrane protein